MILSQRPRTAFANLLRELESDLVPEWRVKYLDYKVRL